MSAFAQEEARATFQGGPFPLTIFLWCGGGDLNPYEITPASTSSNFRPNRRPAGIQKGNSQR